MMISQKMVDRLNQQITNETWSAWIYMAMGYKAEAMNLKVFAQWFFAQAGEEREHAEKFAQYILDQGGEVLLDAIPAVRTDYKTIQEMTEHTLEHEKIVTAQCQEIFKMARDEGDIATESFMTWFINEQVEEVASAQDLVDLAAHAETRGQLMMVENRLEGIVAARQAGEE
jgi:ferritin